jgi:D-arabinose 5-phosphate isomerase GutQ
MVKLLLKQTMDECELGVVSKEILRCNKKFLVIGLGRSG